MVHVTPVRLPWLRWSRAFAESLAGLGQEAAVLRDVQVDGPAVAPRPGRCVHGCHAWLGAPPAQPAAWSPLGHSQAEPRHQPGPWGDVLVWTPLQFGACSESERRTEEYDAQVRQGARPQARAWLWPPGRRPVLGVGPARLSRDPGKLPASDPGGALGAPRSQSCGRLRHVLSCWEASSSPWVAVGL